jgi:outer membrane protein assembly factor BamB
VIFRHTMTGIAAVALCFVLFVATEMFRQQEEVERTRPIDHPRLVALRSDLESEGESEAIVARIRAEELELREEFLVHDFRRRRGAWLLLGGLLVFLLAAKLALSRPPMPVLIARNSTYDPDRGSILLGRFSVIGITALLAATAVVVPLTRERGGAMESAEGIWIRFRGAGGLGIASTSGAPIEIDGREGQEKNLRWKVVTPLPGLSSPVIWNDRLFLTGATPNNREVYCFDSLSGALLWRKPVSAGPESSEIPENIWSETGYAAPSPITDGKHVWALFANGDIVCFDLFGKESWCRNLGLPVNMYGLAASPIIVDEKLILQLDQQWGDDGPESALYALDPDSGEELWRIEREVESSWPTPIPLPTASGTQILTCANPWVIAYEPSNGEELWRADCLEGDGGPSPTFESGLVLAVNVASPLTAIRPDGKGEVTDSHVAWEYDGGLPDVCSLLATGGLVWMLSTDGVATCLETGTGEVVWEHVLEMDFYSSPGLAGEAIYLFGRKGDVVVLGTGREYEELAIGHLGEECDTSPSFAGDRIYVRGRRHLFCFQESDS